MKRKRTRLGRELIASLNEALRRAERGEPFNQTIVRRMKVKGEDVWVRESFEAPLGRRGKL